jgi:rSAM/selenodomain-associated transferase 1
MKAVHRLLDPATFDPTAKNLCALAVMTKAPRAGFVKTRLVPPLTHEEAAALNVCFLRDTAMAISHACGDDARGIGVYTPAGSENAYENILPEDFQLLPQRGEAFGERLRNATEDLFKTGFSAVCLIDSDSPTVPADAYRRAIGLLLANNETVVLGPTQDGGYYLIGVTKLHERVFQEIEWSTERVLEQTKERARQIGLKTVLLPTFYDVDDRVALQQLRDDLLGAKSAANEIAPHTWEFLQKLHERKIL